MLLILGTAGILLVILYTVYSNCFAPYQVLKKCGINGPIPVPLVGNILIFKMSLAKLSKYLYDKYKGPLVGIYFGRRLTVYVKDPEMIKQITVSEFECFVDRPCKVRIVPDEYRVGGLSSTTGEVWKNTRNILTPAFSSSKLKMMLPLIKRSVDILVERMGEIADSGQRINLLEFYSTFTLESIVAAAFGRVVDIQRGKSDELAKAALKAAEMKRDRVIFACIHLLMAMPCLEKLIRLLLRRKYASSWRIMQDVASRLIETRKAELQKTKLYKDILQFMIEASDDTSTNVKAVAILECPIHKPGGSTKHRLSSREILDNSIMLLFDETTKNTLAHISYLLAINPDIQMKLQFEIDNFFREKSKATLYEAAQKIDYLDYTIQESLRLYPPAVTISRLCVKSTTIDSVHIPKGTEVHIPIKQLHYDPKYWDDPERFDPDRFSPKEKAKRPNNVHLPFGAGPRNCIGMRFALLEAKIVLIELLRRFSFVQGPDTKVPLPVPDGFSATPTEGILVEIVHRN